MNTMEANPMFSKSNLKVLTCCHKNKHSKGRGIFYAQIARIKDKPYILLICRTCRKIQQFRVKDKYDVGILNHCFNTPSKIQTTHKKVICICTKRYCHKKQYFERETNEK
jgi:hypothetical protein